MATQMHVLFFWREIAWPPESCEAAEKIKEKYKDTTERGDYFCIHLKY